MKPINKFLTCFFACFFIIVSAFTQDKPYLIFTEDNELASSDVKDIIKDRDGILWIATDLGLSKYDGERFKNIYKIDGLPSNRVWTLAVDYN